MARARNLSKDAITTISAGNIEAGEIKKVAEWEVSILQMLHGKKVEIMPEETPKKPTKGKK